MSYLYLIWKNTKAPTELKRAGKFHIFVALLSNQFSIYLYVFRHLWHWECQLSQDRRRSRGQAEPVPLAGGLVRGSLVLFGLYHLRRVRPHGRTLRRRCNQVNQCTVKLTKTKLSAAWLTSIRRDNRFLIWHYGRSPYNVAIWLLIASFLWRLHDKMSYHSSF